MSGFDLLLGLPVELACEIVGGWLRLKHIVCLDSAFCHVWKREMLHVTIFGSPMCILADTSKTETVRHGWINARNIRMRAVQMDGHSDVASCENVLMKNGSSVTHARLHLQADDFADAANKLQLIARNCANLSFFVCTGDWFVFEELIHVIKASTQLRSIQLSWKNCYIDDAAPANTELPNALRVQYIDLDGEAVGERKVLDLCAHEEVLQLRLSGNYRPDWQQFRKLQGLGFGTVVLQTVTECPWILHLDLSDICPLLDDTLIAIVRAMHGLHSLNLSGTWGVKNTTFGEIARCQKHSLKALYLYDTAMIIGGKGINQVLTECTHLRTICYSQEPGVDLSLMQHITTLVIEYVDNKFLWRSLRLHCAELQYLHIVFPNIEIAPVDIYAVVEALCDLPSLLHVYLVSASLSIRKLIHEALHARRPSLCVTEEEFGAWYTVFKPFT